MTCSFFIEVLHTKDILKIFRPNIWISLSGPFVTCHDYVAPDDYYYSCLYDVCETGDPGLCASLEQYAAACRSRGGDPGTWRAIVTECRKWTQYIHLTNI